MNQEMQVTLDTTLVLCREATEPSAVAPGQLQQTRQKVYFDPALPRSVLCFFVAKGG